MQHLPELKVLDHGFVRLVDCMGDDTAIVQAARVSYGTGTKSVNEDRGLIRYLMRNKHTSPFEMVELKFHLKMPIFVARQHIRHRTANVNEYSARYSVMDKEYYLPDAANVAAQSTINHQGRGESLDEWIAEEVIKNIGSHSEQSHHLYEYLLANKVARELSREVLPVNFYTQMYWKIDLHNLLHYLRLRMDYHAQYEIREYANAMAQIVKELFPLTWEAFNDYVIESKSFSKQEWEILKQYLNDDILLEDLNNKMYDDSLGKTELNEFKAKL